MSSPEVLHEGPEEEMPEAPVTAPPPAPGAPRTPERAAPPAAAEFDIHLVKLTEQLKAAVRDRSSNLSGDEVTELIKAVEQEHGDLIRDRDSDIAKAYRAHIAEFRSTLLNYLATRTRERDAVHASLRNLKNKIQVPTGQEEAEDGAPGATRTTTKVERVVTAPLRFLERILDRTVGRVFPVGRLEKKNKAA